MREMWRVFTKKEEYAARSRQWSFRGWRSFHNIQTIYHNLFTKPGKYLKTTSPLPYLRFVVIYIYCSALEISILKSCTAMRPLKNQIFQKNMLTHSARNGIFSCCLTLSSDIRQFFFLPPGSDIYHLSLQAVVGDSAMAICLFYCPLALVERWQVNAHSPCLEFTSGIKNELSLQ